MLEIAKKSFSDKGYLVVKGGLNRGLLEHAQSVALEELKAACSHHSLHSSFNDNDPTEKQFHDIILSLISGTGLAPYDIQKDVWKRFIREDMPESFLSSSPIVDHLKELIGSDLQYSQGAALTISIPAGQSNSENYLFKKYHQEVWSGSSLGNVQVWTPVFQSSTDGQITVIEGSHKWGIVPNKNRQPIELPEHNETSTSLEYGDVILFHPLLLHRSSSLPEECLVRMGWPMMIRNWRYTSRPNFDERWTWKSFYSSAHSEIELALGNAYLTPYRIKDILSP